MIMALIFIAVGLGLLGFLILLLSRMGPAPEGWDCSSSPASLLPEDDANWTQALGERLFSRTDLEFISKEAPLLQPVLLRDRRAIALSWICRRRATATALMRFHREIARSHADLSPALEIRLEASYLMFLAACGLAQSVIWLRGPFASRKMVSGIMAVGDRVKSLSARIIGEAGLRVAG